VNVAWRTRVDMAEGSVMNAIAEEEKKWVTWCYRICVINASY
jgi:hypothetical protein